MSSCSSVSIFLTHLLEIWITASPETGPPEALHPWAPQGHSFRTHGALACLPSLLPGAERGACQGADWPAADMQVPDRKLRLSHEARNINVSYELWNNASKEKKADLERSILLQNSSLPLHHRHLLRHDNSDAWKN